MYNQIYVHALTTGCVDFWPHRLDSKERLHFLVGVIVTCVGFRGLEGRDTCRLGIRVFSVPRATYGRINNA